PLTGHRALERREVLQRVAARVVQKQTQIFAMRVDAARQRRLAIELRGRALDRLREGAERQRRDREERRVQSMAQPAHQIGRSIDAANGVNSFGPVAVMYQQSSRRTPNSPGI